MNKTLCFAISATLLIGGCKVNKSNSSKDPAIATLGQQPVYLSEFKYVYDKNTVPDSLDKKESLRQYLDLYLNFKLKVLEAQSQGLDTSSSFQQELAGYKQQLAEPYLVDSTITNKLVKEAYDRLKEEIRASHILISLPPDADPKDTLQAYEKLTQIRQQALQGEIFENLAKANSQDPSAQTNGGDLGYFTALQMVYPFEDAAYNTKIGSISLPFRTRFGYHIIKVADRRPSQGKVRTAHIMVRTNPEAPEEDAKAAKQKIDEIYKRLTQGGNWNQLVQEFSEDGSSKNKGGELLPFSTGNMIPSFEEAAFALKKPGDISKPIQTPYGWHIVKLLEKISLEPFEELETTLRQKVTKDSRSELNQTLLIKRLKKENQIVESADALAWAKSQATDSLSAGKWNYTDSKALAKPLFSIQKKKYTIGDFFTFVKENQEVKSKLSPAYYMQLMYEDYLNQSILDYEKAHLAEKYPDYKHLVNEYRDGMLLFQQMEEKVWSYALSDTLGQKKYFENNRKAYQWDQRVSASVYNAANTTVLGEVKDFLNQGKYPVAQPVFNDIYFTKNKSEVSPQNKAQLDNLVSAVAKNKNLVLEVAGYADPSEPENISGARAKSVTDYLVANGVDVTKIVRKDFGRFKPVSKTDRKKNSRVSIQVFSTDKSALEKHFNGQKPLNLEVTSGTFQKGDNDYVDQVNWKPGTYTIEKNNRVVYIVVEKVEEPRPKTFEEARGSVISDYQNFLEKQWIDNLRAKYPVTVNEKEVQKLLESN